MSSANERDYYCSNCGRWLFAATGPLGVQITIRLKCGERSCGKQQSPHVGVMPAPRVDRDAWVAQSRIRRAAAHADVAGIPGVRVLEPAQTC